MEDTDLQNVISQLVLDSTVVPDYTFVNDRLRFKGKLVVGNSKELKLKLLQEFNSSPIGGHSGRRTTFERISQFFTGLL